MRTRKETATADAVEPPAPPASVHGARKRRRRRIAALVIGGILALLAAVGLIPPLRERVLVHLCFAVLPSGDAHLGRTVREYLEALLKDGSRPWLLSRMVGAAARLGASEQTRLAVWAVMGDMPYARIAELTEAERQTLTAEGLAPDRPSEHYRARLLARIGGPDEVALLRGGLLSSSTGLQVAVLQAVLNSRSRFPELRDAYLACLEPEAYSRLPRDSQWALTQLLVGVRDRTLVAVLRERYPMASPRDRARLNAMCLALGDVEALPAYRRHLFQGTREERDEALAFLHAPISAYLIPEVFQRLAGSRSPESRRVLQRTAMKLTCHSSGGYLWELLDWWFKHGPQVDHPAYVLGVLRSSEAGSMPYLEALTWAEIYGLPETVAEARRAFHAAAYPEGRVFAASVAGRLGEPVAVETLIGELAWRLERPEEEGAEAPVPVHALRELTGQNFLNDVPAWREWWRQNRTRWVAQMREVQARFPQVVLPTSRPASAPASRPP